MREYKAKRSLVTSDLFRMSRILKKMDLDIKVKEDSSQEEVGINLIKSILENMHLAEKEIADWCSGLIDITPEEFLNMDLEELINFIHGLVNDEKFKKLFQMASQLKK